MTDSVALISSADTLLQYVDAMDRGVTAADVKRIVIKVKLRNDLIFETCNIFFSGLNKTKPPRRTRNNSITE